MTLKAIPTAYKGHMMRSRLEATTAKMLDAAKVPWRYEQDGYDLDGVWYLPDFYLPDARQFLEVKGIFDEASKQKIHRLALATLATSQIPVVVVTDPRPREAEFLGGQVLAHIAPAPEGVARMPETCISAEEVAALASCVCGVKRFLTDSDKSPCPKCGGTKRRLVRVEFDRGEFTRAEAVPWASPRRHLLLPGPVLDAVGLLAANPGLTAAAEEENLIGVVPAGPLADLARDLLAESVAPGDLAARIEMFDPPERRRLEQLLGPARPPAEAAERELRRSITRARIEIVDVESRRINAAIAAAGAPVPEDLRQESQRVWSRLKDLKEKFRTL